MAGIWFAGEYGDLLLRSCSALPPEEGVAGEEGVDGSAAVWVKPPPQGAEEGSGGGKGGGGGAGEKEGLSRIASALPLGGAGVGAAYSAVEARDVVNLMAKIMKVRG